MLQDKDDGNQDIQTGNADAALQDFAGQRRPDDGYAAQAAVDGPQAHGWSPQHRRPDDPPPWCWTQAEDAPDRFQAREVRSAGASGDDRVRSGPFGAHCAGALLCRREALHPAAGWAKGWSEAEEGGGPG